jgi:hypothetical protein
MAISNVVVAFAPLKAAEFVIIATAALAGPPAPDIGELPRRSSRGGRRKARLDSIVWLKGVGRNNHRRRWRQPRAPMYHS